MRFPEDPTKIDIGQDLDVEYWANKFGIHKDDLFKIVKTIGGNVKAIKKSLYHKKHQR